MASGAQNLGNNFTTRTDRTSEKAPEVKKVISTLRAFVTKFSNDWSMSFAGLLAYGLLTAMVPIAIAIFGIFGLILGSDSSLTQSIIHSLGTIVPGAATQQAITLALKQLNQQAGLLVIIAIALATFGGSRLFISIESCLDIIYRVPLRTFVPQNLMAFGMLLLFVILVPIMIFMAGAPTLLLSLLSSNPALTSIPFFHTVATNEVTIYLGSILGGVIVNFILFEAIYFIVPNQHLSWRNSWKGALFSAVALQLFLILFPLYARFGLHSYSGQIGFAVVLLLFFYYFAVILTLGAEINAFFFEHIQPLPHDLATTISQLKEQAQGDQATPATPLANAQQAEHAKAEQIQMTQNTEEQPVASDTKKHHLFARKDQKREKGKTQGSATSSKLMAVAEVVIGSTVAMVVGWLQIRHRGK
jgi:YihY family inner membrane protein